jgi:hypothetical protein
MERETGIEPATFSLGIRWSFEIKELMRPWRQILNIRIHAKSANCEIALLNAVIAVTGRVLPELPVQKT